MNYRADIDGLRALAVLAVVGFHAFPGAVSGGFVGVDVFFVISGYLITGIMLDTAAAGRFSLAAFYARRIRRIFPALVVVLAACYAAGWWWLFEDRFAQLGKHVAGGAGFASNLLLWQEAGYFDASGETKPLLHLWSLGIEEQFYLAWPLVFYVAWHRRLPVLVIAAGAGAASLAFNLYSIRQDLVGTFYSPATRAWELMAGSLLACAARPATMAGWPWLARVYNGAGARGRDVLSMAGGVAVVGAVMGLNGSRHYPGAWALIPVTGAALLIAAGPAAWLNRVVLAAAPMVWIGLISYPLYLWHWPLLAFPRLWQAGELSVWQRAGAVTLALVLATLTYRLIERPIRFGGWRRSAVPVLSLAMAMMLIAGWQTYRLEGLPLRAINLTDRAHFTKYYEAIKSQEMPAAYREECDFMDWRSEATKATIAPACTEPGSRRTMLLWGDSFAQALSPGIRSLHRHPACHPADVRGFRSAAVPAVTRSGPRLGNELIDVDAIAAVDFSCWIDLDEWDPVHAPHHDVSGALTLHDIPESIVMGDPLPLTVDNQRCQSEVGSIDRGRRSRDIPERNRLLMHGLVIERERTARREIQHRALRQGPERLHVVGHARARETCGRREIVEDNQREQHGDGRPFPSPCGREQRSKAPCRHDGGHQLHHDHHPQRHSGKAPRGKEQPQDRIGQHEHVDVFPAHHRRSQPQAELVPANVEVGAQAHHGVWTIVRNSSRTMPINPLKGLSVWPMSEVLLVTT